MQPLEGVGQPDLAIRFLATRHLAALLPGLLRGHRVEVIAIEQSEVKLVERQTDQVARVRLDEVETILHVEFQTRHEEELPARVLAYHALLRHHHYPLPVRSLVVYLMHEPPPRAIVSGIAPRAEDPQVTFRYDVFCPWEQPLTVEDVRRHPGLAPVASLTPGIGMDELPALRQAVEESAIEGRGDLLAVLFLLAGRRFPEDVVRLFVRSKAMEESSTYQAILEEGRAEGVARGRAEELRRSILELAEAHFAAVPEGLEGRLSTLDAEALRGLFSRLVRAADAAALERLLAG